MSEFDEFENDAPKSGDDLSTRASIRDLDGRHILIFPFEAKTMEGDSGTYEAVFGDVIILDGKLDPEVGIHQIPATCKNFMFTSWQIRENLKPRIGRKLDDDTKPYLLGKVNSQRSKNPKAKGGTAYGIEKADRSIYEAASKAKADYLAQRQADEFEDEI